MSLTMVLYYWDLFFGLHPSPIEASSIDRTQKSRFHLMTREEPSLEMLWFEKHKGDEQSLKNRSQ
jgi:hypothetical protein